LRCVCICLLLINLIFDTAFYLNHLSEYRGTLYLSQQLAKLKIEFQGQKKGYFIDFASLFVNQVVEYRKTPGKTNVSQWVDEIVNLQRRQKQ
jgi:hypothetical protein